MKKENEILNNLKNFLKEDVLESRIARERRIFIRIEIGVLKDAIKHLKNELEFNHLSTITGLDLGEELELIYHLAHKGAIELSLIVKVPKETPTIPTIVDLIPGAELYEREVHELFGLKFKGHPDLSPLLLPEGWPRGVYPLRKECDIEKLRDLTNEERE